MDIRVKTPLTRDIILSLGYQYSQRHNYYYHPDEVLNLKFQYERWYLYHKDHELRQIEYLETLIDAYRVLGTGWSLLAMQLQDIGYS